MGRYSKKDDITNEVLDYISLAKTDVDMVLSISGVADNLKINRRKLYEYTVDGHSLAELIKAALAERKATGVQKGVKGKNKRLKAKIRKVEARNRALLERIVLMEYNIKRFGIDPEELYQPMPKPNRSTPHTRRKRN